MSSIRNKLKKTVRVSRDSDPEIYDIFSSLVERFDLRIPVRLRKGEIGYYDGLAFGGKNRAFVLLAESILRDLRDPYPVFVLGHELGHLVFRQSGPEDAGGGSIMPGTAEFERRMPDTPASLMYKYSNVLREQIANLYGTAACGGLENALDIFRDWNPTLDVDNILFPERSQAKFPPDPVSGFDIFSELELNVFRSMVRSRRYREDILCGSSPSPVETSIIEDDEAWDEIFTAMLSLGPFSSEDHDMLARFTGAALYVCASGFELERNRRNYDYSLDGSSDYYFRYENVWDFTCVGEAVEEMEETRGYVRDIAHPMKYEAFRAIAEASRSMEWDRDASHSFIFGAGEDMGFSLFETMDCIGRFG